MRKAIAAVLLTFAATGIAHAVTRVDLDQPGAMDALERDRPAHHKRVMDEISKAQTIHVEPRPITRDARMDERSKDATTLLPSHPAKKRILVGVDGIEYRVTVQMTKDPAKLEKAK
jgi:hypothetical protein